MEKPFRQLAKELGILVGIIVIAFVVLDKTTNVFSDDNNNPIEEIKKQKAMLLEIQDRSDEGICRGMYEEGFNWGHKQEEIDWFTFHITEDLRPRSRAQRAEEWYSTWEDRIKSNK